MRTIHAVALAATLISFAGAVPAAAQQAPGRPAQPRAMMQRGMMGPDAVSRLLERKDELALTADQVSKLEAIQARYREANAAPRATIESLRPDSAERAARRQEAERRRSPEAREAMRTIAENNRKMQEEVRDVLTDEQRGKLQQDRARMRRGAPGRPGAPMRRGSST